MKEPIQVGFASSTEDLVPTLIEKMREIHPALPLYVVSEFPVENARWVPFHYKRTLRENLALCRSVFAGKQIVFAGMILQPLQPYWPMRALALWIAGWRRMAFFNDNLDHFMIRPRSALTIARHLWWRSGNYVRWQTNPGGELYTFLWRLWHPYAFLRPLAVIAARATGSLIAATKRMRSAAAPPALQPWPGDDGISVVIPSRSGRALLQRLLPGLVRELEGFPSEIIVVDNGSFDGTRRWLASEYPSVAVEHSEKHLSFAHAVNRGIGRARYSKLLLLNNDMTLEPGFFPALLEPFSTVPDLFCATAQILLPPGQRREETGKAVMTPEPGPQDFPVRCDLPVEGENHSYVLYGSGGCSLFDSAMLRALGGLDESYEPAYVEDLDLGFRGWQRGWPSVFVAGAKVVHRHRSTTSRYYSQRELDRVLERNYLRFLAGSVSSGDAFARLWTQACSRLNLRAARQVPEPAAMYTLRRAWKAMFWTRERPASAIPEENILAIGSGDVAVFPCARRRGRPVILVASPYIPFPLSHGGAVRMFNLMRAAADHYDQVLVSFVDELHTPPPELARVCCEILEVRRRPSHTRPLTHRPDTVEEFDSPAFDEAIRQVVRKWRPAIAQLEFTQMAQYADACAPAKTILVEHDITLDLYAQLLARGEDWETRLQSERWEVFERDAWARVDAVAVMSEKDRRTVAGPNAVVLPNGVDLERFRPSGQECDPRRILFIGSFAHLPNVLAVDWFLRSIWPDLRLQVPDAKLHIIAGSRPEYFLDRYRERANPPLEQPGVLVDAFVPDPRPAYSQAAVVIAPLLASAGTNIKIMEAMAMGKAIVSTPAGVNGLDEIAPGRDLLVAREPAGIASAIAQLLADPQRRTRLEQSARATAERCYGWDAIARRQRALYRRLAE